MKTKTDIQDWLEAQNKDSKVTLTQSDMRVIELALSGSILEAMTNKDKSFDERFDSVEMYRAVRDKIEAHIVRQAETGESPSERRALADEVRDQIRGNKCVGVMRNLI